MFKNVRYCVQRDSLNVLFNCNFLFEFESLYFHLFPYLFPISLTRVTLEHSKFSRMHQHLQAFLHKVINHSLLLHL
ncbi:hypothetical protein Lalb_Chr23g0273511 [Lupinus albus]|uniref:Uncharacterized protein n=1 Tax=Lupinus albus TaxID=3870 RepID=A0A6A4NLK9_LUPAL|nr:hypothetical protein Lalb_Chr23g0273511 [Lupinus albus]